MQVTKVSSTLSLYPHMIACADISVKEPDTQSLQFMVLFIPSKVENYYHQHRVEHPQTRTVQHYLSYYGYWWSDMKHESVDTFQRTVCAAVSLIKRLT